MVLSLVEEYRPQYCPSPIKFLSFPFLLSRVPSRLGDRPVESLSTRSRPTPTFSLLVHPSVLDDIHTRSTYLRYTASGSAEFDQCDPTTFFATRVDLDMPRKRGIATLCAPCRCSSAPCRINDHLLNQVLHHGGIATGSYIFEVESGIGPGASLKEELMQPYAEEVFEAVVQKYIFYITAMHKKEDDGRDEEWIRQQMVFDIQFQVFT